MYQTDSSGVQTTVTQSTLRFLIHKFQVRKIKLDNVYEMPRTSVYLIYFDIWINVYTNGSYWSSIRVSKGLHSSVFVNWIYLVNWITFWEILHDLAMARTPAVKSLITLELPHILLTHKLGLFFCLSRTFLIFNFSIKNTFHFMFLLSMIEYNYIS